MISAACHQPPEDTEAAYKPIKWGEVMEHNMSGLEAPLGRTSSIMEYEANDYTALDRPGHCCFTSYDVVMPTVGKAYR